MNGGFNIGGAFQALMHEDQLGKTEAKCKLSRAVVESFRSGSIVNSGARRSI
jgi:hypothetical protein